MANKITEFIREFIFIFSIITTILGLGLFLSGIIAMFAPDIPKDVFGLSENTISWNLYIVIIGFIVLLIGAYYLYVYLINRKFILEEIKTNKRSEFIKKHPELKIKVKKMPTKFKKMVKEKEDELKIK